MVAKPLKTKSKLPVSRHPLFAPMVALWFAALFGLGSLAIRPTLLESVILALRIDLVIPAAAPPLGFTFRILLALSLFVIGGGLGYVLARRFARPAAQKSAGTRFSKVKAAAETAVHAAVDAYDEDDDFARLASARRIEDDAANANAIPGRRRALAMEEDFTTEVHDLAPVPGHKPQILDLADLGAFDEDELPESAEEVAAPVAAAEDDEPKFDPWRRHPNASPAMQVFVEDAAEADAPAQFTAPFAAPLQASEAHADFSRPHAADHGEAPDAFAAPAFAPPADFSAPSFSEPASFAPPPHSPFAASVAEDEAIAEPEAEIAPEPVAAFTPAPLDFLAPSQPVPSQSAPSQAAPSLPVFGAAAGDAAERLVAMPLTSLGVVQLAERLALAIARKRDVAAVASPAPAVLPGLPASLAAPQPPVPVAFPLPPSLTPPPAMDFAAAEPVEPVSETEPEVETEDAFEAAEVPAEPAAGVTQLFGQSSALPAALRPLNFDDHADEPLPSILPPRGFPKLPEQLAAAQSEPEAPAEPVAYEDEGTVTDATGEEEIYASLLEMKTPARAFVRIEEPEAELASVEPVVIFPGQDNRHAFANGGTAFPSANGEDMGRLFDAPPSSNSPLRMPPAVARSVDAEETERQLKAALATLQRMSGAA